LRKRHQRTLDSIFRTPTASDLEWRDVESLLAALGAVVTRQPGSSRAVSLNGRRFVCHEPHDPAILPKGMVNRVRDFLESVGVEP
jgi:hypothetical protein